MAHSLLNRSSWWENSRSAGLASIPPALLAVGVCCYQLAYPRVLHGVFSYDDGVYFGSAVYLIHGIVPYRDFTFVAPPGITLIMTPFALLTHVTTTNQALAVARVFTALVAGANVLLAGLVVRHRGIAASAAAATALAVFPSAYLADSTVMLEPYLVFFCLLAAVLLFQNGDLAAGRRVWLAGVAFGLAVAVDLRGVVPFVIAVAFCIPLWRRAIVPLLGGAAIAFGVTSLPFLLLGPGAFARDVVLTVWERSASGAVGGTAARVLALTGLGSPLGLHVSAHGAVAVALVTAAVLGLIFVAAALTARASRFDGFAFASMVAVTLVIVLAPSFSGHDSYFAAPFIAIVFGLAIRYVLEVLTGICAAVAGGSYVSVDFATRTGLTLIMLALVVAGAVTTTRREAPFTRSFFAGAAGAPGRAIARVVPPGKCVVTDESSFAISANRFSAGVFGCPTVLDPLGTWLVEDPGHPPSSPPPQDPTLVGEWQSWLAQADYVVLATQGTSHVPWTPALRRWFDRAFVSVGHPGGVDVYRRLTGAVVTAARAG